jgi:hypothetical protein
MIWRIINSMEGNVEYTDRYQALGIAEPDIATVCPGDCEGTGMVPIYVGPSWDQAVSTAPVSEVQAGTDARYLDLWQAAEREAPSADGWHFVQCLDCHGSGRR